MSRYPATIQVGPYQYAVLEDDALSADENLYGDVNYGKQRIRIYPRLGPDQTAAVLLHEVLHACQDILGRNTNSGDGEDWITGMAPLLLDTFRRNPELMRCLLGGEP